MIGTTGWLAGIERKRQAGRDRPRLRPANSRRAAARACGSGVSRSNAGMAGEPPQQRAQVVAAAFAEVIAAACRAPRRQRRSGGEPRVVAVFARQHGERDAAFARQRRQPLDAVFPPIETAEQAHHDHLGVRADAIDPQIDRHRMTQVAQMREPNARQRGALGLPRGGEPGEIAVGERQHRDIARRLAEIDRFDDVVEVGRGRRQQVHRLAPCYPTSACVTAARSSPLSPITTEPAFARFIGSPGPVVLVRHPRARRLGANRRSGLSATAAKPLTRSTSNFSASAATRAASAAGSAISASGTTKESKSSWSCSSSSSWRVRRLAISSSVPTPSPSSSCLIDLAVGDGDHFDAARQQPGDRGLRFGDAGRRRSGRAC